VTTVAVVLVLFDGSAQAGEAVRLAASLARRTGASVELVRIAAGAAMEHDGGAGADDGGMYALVEWMREQGLDARAKLVPGSAHETAVAVAEEREADLIVLAPRARGRLTQALPFGMTEHLLVQSPAPFLVWPQHEAGRPPYSTELLGGPSGLVLCPLDGSDVAERALPWAIALARELKRTLLVVRVVPASRAIGSSLQAAELIRETQREEEHAAIHYLRALRHRLAHEDDLTVETMALSGDGADEILRLSTEHEASVVVMSTHGRGGLARVVLGSVAAEVVHFAPVPVLVVPPRAALNDASLESKREEAQTIIAGE
jgi:nucleotide-binding universal stress UspA family protein